jgi:SSS family solute:Na+ symporter
VLAPAVTVAGVSLLGDAYLTWDVALWGMLLSLLLTAGVSAMTPAAPEEDARTFAVGAD